MKSVITSIMILFSIQFAFAQNSKTGNLTVIVTGIESNEGVVKIGLYNSRENYEGKEKPFKGLKVTIENRKAIGAFENIPFGVYAVKLYHDENSNGKLDKNFLGIPTEDYAFSNNASGTFGPADYDDAKFIFNKNKMKIEITISY